MFDAIANMRQRLTKGDVLVGTGIYLIDTQVSEALADSVDFLWYDMEHNAFSMEVLRSHLMVARNRNQPTIVRVSDGSTPFIKPVLDAGANGIVVPQVRSVDEVERIVSDCRYPPLGRRGYGPLLPTNYGRVADDEYVELANANIFVSVMIENGEALENIDKIVAVPGLDSVFIGPWDLSASLGLLGQVEHPTMVAAMERIVAAARRAGLVVGSGMPVDAEFAGIQAKRGVQLLQVGGDCVYLIRCADQLMGDIRDQLRN